VPEISESPLAPATEAGISGNTINAKQIATGANTLLTLFPFFISRKTFHIPTEFGSAIAKPRTRLQAI
jgi:hypothetical protein